MLEIMKLNQKDILINNQMIENEKSQYLINEVQNKDMEKETTIGILKK